MGRDIEEERLKKGVLYKAEAAMEARRDQLKKELAAVESDLRRLRRRIKKAEGDRET